MIAPLKPAVIVDLDGTIADLTHRQHFLERKPKDWKAFFAAMPDDAPIGFIISLMEALWHRYYIAICTGRPHTYEAVTKEWLSKFHVPYDRLMMRDQDLNPDEPSWQSDPVIKMWMLATLRSEGRTVLCAIDDRPSVIKMWRENGVPCLAMDDASWVRQGLT